jgi:hypothetical protein
MKHLQTQSAQGRRDFDFVQSITRHDCRRQAAEVAIAGDQAIGTDMPRGGCRPLENGDARRKQARSALQKKAD